MNLYSHLYMKANTSAKGQQIDTGLNKIHGNQIYPVFKMEGNPPHVGLPCNHLPEISLYRQPVPVRNNIKSRFHLLPDELLHLSHSAEEELSACDLQFCQVRHPLSLKQVLLCQIFLFLLHTKH